DVRALPEINNSRVGWLIHVPKDVLGEAVYRTVEERLELSQIIEEGLENVIRSIVEDPSSIAIKGQAALDQIREQHDPQTYAEKLRQIYRAAIA
ncbi:MAG: hypothetical protein VB026_09475, partial [Anaerolineaceae bacterium]|nr:hypothetical protein [Anaerolineaceae bacterium]